MKTMDNLFIPVKLKSEIFIYPLVAKLLFYVQNIYSLPKAIKKSPVNLSLYTGGVNLLRRKPMTLSAVT